MDPRRLGSTNVATWYFASSYFAPDVQRLVADLHPRYVRIPGGSYANGTYWNGHGVRGAEHALVVHHFEKRVLVQEERRLAALDNGYRKRCASNGDGWGTHFSSQRLGGLGVQSGSADPLRAQRVQFVTL